LILFAAAAYLYNPVSPVRLSRDAWFGLNVAAAVLFAAGAWLLRWDLTSPVLKRVRALLNEAVTLTIMLAWPCFLAHVAIALVAIVASYVLFQDGRLAADWYSFRSKHSTAVIVAIATALAAYFVVRVSRDGFELMDG
jgi:hypothetical protein